MNFHLGFGYFGKKEKHQEDQRGEACHLLLTRQGSPDGGSLELQKLLPAKGKQCFIHTGRGRLSNWRSNACAVWLQEQKMSTGTA